MAYERRTITGGVPATTLSGGIDGSTLSITITSATGWPTGSVGDFGVVINRGEADEEKCLIDTRTGTTLTVVSGGRGVDGTSGVAHSAGATIEHCLLARDLDESNAHISDTALDHHTQYLNTTRHDVEARHTFGSALGTPAAASDIATAAATGSGDNPAREDHVHKIGTGAINSAAMFAAGVVDAAAIATDGVGTAEIAAGAVGASELASDAVTTIKILDDNVTAAKIADGAIDAEAKLASGVVTLSKFGSGLRPITVVADGTARDALTAAEGDLAWQQDLNLYAWYNGSAWRWLPGQTLARVQLTSTISGIGAGPVYVTGLEVTFDGLGGPVRAHAHYQLTASGTGGAMRSTYRTSGGTQIDVLSAAHVEAGDIIVMDGHIYETPAAGSTVRRVYHAGAGSPDVTCSATAIAFFEVVSA